MIQIFVFGASNAYGVGGTDGGWADMLKRKIHERMYRDGIGERIELFNFARSGAKLTFVQDTYRSLLDMYRRDGKSIILLGMGGNNAKAENEPDNFVSTPEEYRVELTRLLTDLKTAVDTVVFVGSGWVDEGKTNPKHNPLTGGRSYFTNARYELFKGVQREICASLDIPVVSIDIPASEWTTKYLYADGLHANDAGYAYIAERVWQTLEPMLEV
jgi:lysophospholipase L1-like esterase